jgi:hypothetical protein
MSITAKLLPVNAGVPRKSIATRGMTHQARASHMLAHRAEGNGTLRRSRGSRRNDGTRLSTVDAQIRKSANQGDFMAISPFLPYRHGSGIGIVLIG